MEFGLNGGKRFSRPKLRGTHMRRAVALSEPANRHHRAAKICGVWSVCSALFLWTAFLAASNSAAIAQNQQRLQRLSPAQQQAQRDRQNASTLIVATSHPTASYFAMAHAIASAIEKNDDLRLLPMSSGGGIETLRDLVFLRGVDLAIVPVNALAQAETTGSLGSGLPQRIAYIARLYNEEVHLLVGRNTKVLADLSGKKIAVPQEDGSALFTARDLFARFSVDVEIVRMPAAEALELVRAGDLAATLLMAGKPLPLLADMPKDGSIRLLALPFVAALEDGYVPAAFRAEDYPMLIPDGLVVESVAVSAVLMAHSAKNAEGSSQRAAKFVPAFFDATSEHLLKRYTKWEVNLAATLPGWSRLPAAEEWLRSTQRQQALSLQKNFEEFLRETQPPGSPPLPPAQRKKLFDEFVSWTRKSVSETEALIHR
jgi:TRAP-type uncharacterized transport system substrate-binding protein